MSLEIDKTAIIKSQLVTKLQTITSLKSVMDSRFLFVGNKSDKYPWASVYCMSDSAEEQPGERAYHATYPVSILLTHKGLDVSQCKDSGEIPAIVTADRIAKEIKQLLGNYMETLGDNIFRMIYRSTNTADSVDGDSVVITKLIEFDAVSFEERNAET